MQVIFSIPVIFAFDPMEWLILTPILYNDVYCRWSFWVVSKLVIFFIQIGHPSLFFTNRTLINCLIVIKPGKKLLYSLWCWTSLRTLSQTVARLAVRLYTEGRHLTDIGCFPSEYRRDCALMYLRITKSFLTSVNSVYRKLWLLLLHWYMVNTCLF